MATLLGTAPPCEGDFILGHMLRSVVFLSRDPAWLNQAAPLLLKRWHSCNAQDVSKAGTV